MFTVALKHFYQPCTTNLTEPLLFLESPPCSETVDSLRNQPTCAASDRECDGDKHEVVLAFFAYQLPTRTMTLFAAREGKAGSNYGSFGYC